MQFFISKDTLIIRHSPKWANTSTDKLQPFSSTNSNNIINNDNLHIKVKSLLECLLAWPLHYVSLRPNTPCLTDIDSSCSKRAAGTSISLRQGALRQSSTVTMWLVIIINSHFIHAQKVRNLLNVSDNNRDDDTNNDVVSKYFSCLHWKPSKAGRVFQEVRPDSNMHDSPRKQSVIRVLQVWCNFWPDASSRLPLDNNSQPSHKWTRNTSIYDAVKQTSNVTGRHRGPKCKLRAGVACAAHFCRYVAPSGDCYYKKFRFFRSLRCWASPMWKIPYSLNHSLTQLIWCIMNWSLHFGT